MVFESQSRIESDSSIVPSGLVTRTPSIQTTRHMFNSCDRYLFALVQLWSYVDCSLPIYRTNAHSFGESTASVLSCWQRLLISILLRNLWSKAFLTAIGQQSAQRDTQVPRLSLLAV